MAGTQSVFKDSVPISNELYYLVQDQLSKTPRTNTLDDLRTMAETLSTITSACESVFTDISARGQEIDLRTAVKGTRNVLTWTKCSSTIRLTLQGRANMLSQFSILLTQRLPIHSFSSARTSTWVGASLHSSRIWMCLSTSNLDALAQSRNSRRT